MGSSTKTFSSSNQFSGDALTGIDGQRFRFKKKSYACSVLILLLFRFELIGGLISISGGSINYIQFFITSTILMLPILYMLFFIGHYSKLGCFVIGRIVPVTHGVGYTMLVTTIIEAVYELSVATQALTYLTASISTAAPWMICRKEWGNNCIGLDYMEKFNSKEERVNLSIKFTDVTQLSAYKYRFHTLRLLNEDLHPEKSDRFWKKVEGTRFLYLLICVLILALFTDLNLPGENRSTNLFYCFYLVSMILFTVVIILNLTNSEAVGIMLKVNKGSLVDTQTWFFSVLYFLKATNMSNVATTLIGSYLPLNAMSDLQAFIVWIGIMTLYFLGELMSCLMRSAVGSRLGVPAQSIKVNGMETIMILYPMFFGSLTMSSQSFCIFYFFLMLIASLYRVKLLITCIYHTMADARPIIRLYRFYIRVFSCLFLLILAFPICLVGKYSGFTLLLRSLEDCLNMVVLVIICACIMYIYGTQTLCDDHHFTYGSQPAIFFKVTLLMAPVTLIVFGVLLFLHVSSSNNFKKHEDITQFLFGLFPICMSPQCVGLLYITTYYLKRQNMAHLLKFEEAWGDPNPTARKERIIYHPRKETNYFRRKEVCKHQCLRYNRVYEILVKEETSMHNEAYRILKKEQKIFTDEEVGFLRDSSSSSYMS